MQYLWGAGGGSVLVFEAHGQAPGESEENRSSKEAFEGSAQLQAGAGNEINQATAFEEVTRPVQMPSRLRALFLPGRAGAGIENLVQVAEFGSSRQL